MVTADPLKIMGAVYWSSDAGRSRIKVLWNNNSEATEAAVVVYDRVFERFSRSMARSIMSVMAKVDPIECPLTHSPPPLKASEALAWHPYQFP